MTSNSKVRDKLLEIIQEVLDNKNINGTEEIKRLALDSLNFIDLVVRIEKKMGLRFEDEFMLLHKYETLEDLFTYVESKI